MKTKYNMAVDVECHRCKHKWKFSGRKIIFLGKYPVFAQCPNCRTSTKVYGKKDKNIHHNPDNASEKKCPVCVARGFSGTN